MKALLAIGLLALVAPLGAGETKLGTGVTLKEATAIKALVEQPAAYVGKTASRRRRRDRGVHAHGLLDGGRGRRRREGRRPFASRSTMA